MGLLPLRLPPKPHRKAKPMNDPCEVCLNNVQDEYGSYYCAEGGSLDEDEMARYLSHATAACPFFEPGDEYKIVNKQI